MKSVKHEYHYGIHCFEWNVIRCTSQLDDVHFVVLPINHWRPLSNYNLNCSCSHKCTVVEKAKLHTVMCLSIAYVEQSAYKINPRYITVDSLWVQFWTPCIVMTICFSWWYVPILIVFVHFLYRNETPVRITKSAQNLPPTTTSPASCAPPALAKTPPMDPAPKQAPPTCMGRNQWLDPLPQCQVSW